MKKFLFFILITCCIFLTSCSSVDTNYSDNDSNLSIGDTADLEDLSLTLLNVEPSSISDHIRAQFAVDPDTELELSSNDFSGIDSNGDPTKVPVFYSDSSGSYSDELQFTKDDQNGSTILVEFSTQTLKQIDFTY